jgi:dTDP-4-amino-4,6-dideoxygalactose transaminase
MTPQGMIPFLDLVTPHRELEEELVAMFRECIRNAHFIGGKVLEDFEKEFAQFCDTRFSVGLASGTDAVRFALMAGGLKDGELVATVPNTFIATTEAITQAGGRTDL